MIDRGHRRTQHTVLAWLLLGLLGFALLPWYFQQDTGLLRPCRGCSGRHRQRHGGWLSLLWLGLVGLAAAAQRLQGGLAGGVRRPGGLAAVCIGAQAGLRVLTRVGA
jgi:hypothetical protein